LKIHAAGWILLFLSRIHLAEAIMPESSQWTRVLISGTRRGLTPKLIADLRRRSAIGAEIGHMKTDGRLSRCPLKGTIGDAVFAVMNACGHNIRKILAHLRTWLAWLIAVLSTPEVPPNRRYLTAETA
jgi:IS5 family transposase